MKIGWKNVLAFNNTFNAYGFVKYKVTFLLMVKLRLSKGK